MIKPCPFCGANGSIGGDSHFYWVFCFDEECDACGPICKTEEEAIQKWNKAGRETEDTQLNMKVCPFCGDYCGTEKHNGYYNVFCLNNECTASGPNAETLLLAIDKWNNMVCNGK